MNDTINRRKYSNWIVVLGNEALITRRLAFRGTAKQAERQTQAALLFGSVAETVADLYWESEDYHRYRTFSRPRAEEMRHMTPAEAGRLRELQAERLQRLAKELRDQVARCTEGETV